MKGFYTTNQLAELLGVEAWRVRRLFEDGTLNDPGRFGGKRAIPKTLIPQIVDALRHRLATAHGGGGR